MCNDLLELEYLWIVWLIYILLSLFYCGLLNNILGFSDYDGTELAHLTRWRILNIFSYLFVFLVFRWASLVAQILKHLLAMQETLVQSPEKGNGNPLLCSYLENSRDRRAWWATVHRSWESDTAEIQHTSQTSKCCKFTNVFLSTNDRTQAF